MKRGVRNVPFEPDARKPHRPRAGAVTHVDIVVKEETILNIFSTVAWLRPPPPPDMPYTQETRHDLK